MELETNKKTETGSKSAPQQGKDKLAREQQKVIQREENRLKKQVEICEDEITKLEQAIAALDKEFENPDFFLDLANSRLQQKKRIELTAKLESVMNDWTENHEKYDAFRIDNDLE